MMTEIEVRHYEMINELFAELILTLGAEEERILTRIKELSHDFAKELIALGSAPITQSQVDEFDFESDTRFFFPIWWVDGTPSKKGRSIAKAWLLERGVNWKGNVKVLRTEVESALARGETVPQLGFDIALEAVPRTRFVNQIARTSLTKNSASK